MSCPPPLVKLLFLISWLVCSLLAQEQRGQAQDDDFPFDFVPGLVAEFRQGEAVVKSVARDVRYQWPQLAPDPRLPPGEFTATWTGDILFQAAGEFQLHVYGVGRISIALRGQTILEASPDQPTWIESVPVSPGFGRHAVEIRYASKGSASELGLFWTGPGFGLEPISTRYFSHETDEPIDNPFEQGRQLSRALRCAACHQFAGFDEDPLLPAPDLTHLHDNLRPSWLVAHLQSQHASQPLLADRKMPLFGLARNDALAISAALFDASSTSHPADDLRGQLREHNENLPRRADKLRTEPDVDAGATVFVSRGCLACHSLESLGRADAMDLQLYSGGDLSRIAVKRTAPFLTRWLDDPGKVNTAHRMPRFQLSTQERMDLVAFLAEQGKDESRNDTRAAGDINRGMGLINQHRCGACHKLPEPVMTATPTKIAVDKSSDWSGGCLSGPDARNLTPGFGLSPNQIESLRAYYSSRQSEFVLDAQQLVAENNCLACHAREQHRGIAAHLPAVATAYPETAARLAALAPPALNSVGDKLKDQAIVDAISGKQAALRPWLDVQMPQFALEPAAIERMAEYFIQHDRLPGTVTTPESRESPISDTADEIAAARLVTAQGFGCQSCHAIGAMEAPKVDLKAQGTNLHMLGQRIRESWFQRWVRNPSRIVPRMEMPAIELAASGVLGNDLDLQLDALWRTLNRPDFVPPRPNPTRIVRNHNQAGVTEQAKLVTNVIETAAKSYLRPLAVGLPNRHNVLIDLEEATLAGWWIGDTAAQYTRGKTWYWEPGAQWLNDNAADASSDARRSVIQRLQLVDADGNQWQPVPNGQFATRLDAVEHIDGGIVWNGMITFGRQDGRRTVPIHQKVVQSPRGAVIETELELADAETIRVLTEAGEFRPFSPPDGSGASGIATFFMAEGLSGRVEVTAGAMTDIDGGLALSPAGNQLRWRLGLEAELPQDTFPLPAKVEVAYQPQSLECVPGFEVLTMPLPRAEMPISMAWGADGKYYIGSLKGRVLEVVDSDGDTLFDDYKLVSDEIPSPYGLSVLEDGSIDALAKYGLLRLIPPSSGDGVWDFQVVADGWGYTADYHDWAVGLERDRDGSYLMVLPCQQDDRSEAAAYLRGHAIRLVPNLDSTDSSRVFRLEPFAAGLRFPMGLALNQRGELFATDNQGNYNPFNELNHLRPGKRYGFINKLENKDGFSPPFESPAINLPHPWSRSVNGICWLDTPDSAKEAPKSQGFGPFEGHLVGCEMNGRSLVRLSLQGVDGQYQGAAYDFSLPGLDASQTFEGPIVCKVAPDGDLYVGNLQDSGWGGGQNTGSINRIRPTGRLPLGIAEVLASADGFNIIFTGPVASELASDTSKYQVRSYRRISTPAYGGEDQDERQERVVAAQPSPDGHRVALQMAEPLRAGCVYEISVESLAQGNDTFFPAQAHYTMRVVPSR